MPLVVDTRTGRVRGRLDRGVTAFRGVPFARAPLGALRLRAPAPVDPWTGVRECAEPGPAAPQNPSRFAALFGDRVGAQSEDCLTLDLWTAGFEGIPRPVLAFVHGGGFAEGAAGDPCARGRRLARGGDAVVVNLQYRLGALGFYAPNVGLLDLCAGLEWVRDEIDAFGGDPGQVTLYGHGAGATAVACLLAMPRARGLFQRAIVSSASFDADSRERAEARRHAFRRALELPAGDEAKLAGLPLPAILAAQARAGGFRPQVDGELLPAAPLEAAASGAGPALPLLVGTARDETRIHELVDPSLAALRPEDVPARLEALGLARVAAEDGFALARALEPGASPNTLFHRAGTELRYAEPARRLADAHAARGAPVFAYRFDLSGWSAQGGTGAFHGLELPLVFGTRRVAPLGRFFEEVPGAKPVGRRMRDAWTAFARSADPRAPLLPQWPRYTAEGRYTQAFSESG